MDYRLEALQLFVDAMNGRRAQVEETVQADQLATFLGELIDWWKLGDVLRLTRKSDLISLERIDGGPQGGWPERV